MKKILFTLTLLTLCSCGSNKVHESQGGYEYEWLSGSIGLPLSWISTDTLVTPLADEFTDYPQRYSEEIKCKYQNGKEVFGWLPPEMQCGSPFTTCP